VTGLSLAEARFGTPGALPTLLIAHGLFGSGRNWGVIARRLAEDRQVVTVDLRNHGDSPWSDDHGYLDLAGDLAESVGALGGPVDLLGHSMGGKAAMALAVTQPALVRRLIVADIAPVAYGHTQQHLIDAMRAMGRGFDSRAAADAALAAHVDDPGTRAFLLQSLDMKHHRWRLNLDALQAHMADILSFPRLDGAFPGPTLFLAGGSSDYVLPAHRTEIQRLFPAARFARIPGAGHWLHAEKPRETEAAVRIFLA
jgi:pimeloyl-ACP methyl ester carboxylesterase